MAKMRLDYFTFLNSLPETPESECAYYPDRNSKVKGFLYKEKIPPEILDDLFRFGFRRSGNFFYRTNCSVCSHCLSYRVMLSDFFPSSNHKRIIKKNQDLTLQISLPLINDEKKNLYVKYQRSRHEGSYGESESEILENMRFQMYEGSLHSRELLLYKNDVLLGWILLDLGLETVSAVYSVFDPEERKRSLGNFLILSSILWAKENSFKEFQLGLFLPGHPKMDYKKNWKPSEILDRSSGVWKESGAFLSDYISENGPNGDLVR
ncbi:MULTISPECIES: arginyltransferase [unclassified Leptospira]|uniref:arginyltransferase n=1 Tax=unclassified Leptospira TaxID=2633828 RepID=UPI0002BDB88B|nr:MULTISPECIES: arginyltransferase [unclassified Leptospira]EMJ96972.1 arginyltransferase [Leptospira sp. B5-022]MCR1792581.1 arginyltransferase [Leptospira sp. id769339]